MMSFSVLRATPLMVRLWMAIVLTYLVVAIFAPVIAPYSETEIVGQQYQPATAEHLLGTDGLGRDLLSRVIYGARNSVGLALLTTALTFSLGVSLGLLAAARGGWIDQALSRLVDIIMAIPSLISALLLLTIYGTSAVVLVLVIAVLESTRVFRLARAVALNVVTQDFFTAARLRKETTYYLVRHELLPNVTTPLFVEFGLRFCFVFLFISALSFLGLGLQPPTADWGAMVRENATLISFGIFTPLIPAAAIALLTIAINAIVDWALDGKSGSRQA